MSEVACSAYALIFLYIDRCLKVVLIYHVMAVSFSPDLLCVYLRRTYRKKIVVPKGISHYKYLVIYI